MNFAHGGLNDSSKPANSLAAVVAAAEAGYGVEIDIQVSQDGVAFLLHEANAFKETGINLEIGESHSRDLENLTHLNGMKVTTLKEVLQHISPQVPLLVDLKDTNNAKRLLKAVLPHLSARLSATAVQSFQPSVVSLAKRWQKQLAVGQLLEEANDAMTFMKKFQTRFATSNFLTRPDFLPVYLPVIDSRMVRFWHRTLSAPLIAWTVTSETEMQFCEERGIAMIFESVRP